MVAFENWASRSAEVPEAAAAGTESIVPLQPADAQRLLAFRQWIIDGLPDKDFLHEEPDEPAFVRRLLGEGALTLAIVSGARLLAFTALILPAGRSELEALGLGAWPARAADPVEIAYIAATMVAPDCRGRGYQNMLTRARDEATSRLGRVHHLATAALGNHFSWRNAMANGFGIADIVTIDDANYGPLTRFLLHRAPLPPTVAGPLVWAEATDARRQAVLLASGYRGVQHRWRHDVMQVGYRRLVRR